MLAHGSKGGRKEKKGDDVVALMAPKLDGIPFLSIVSTRASDPGQLGRLPMASESDG